MKGTVATTAPLEEGRREASTSPPAAAAAAAARPPPTPDGGALRTSVTHTMASAYCSLLVRAESGRNNAAATCASAMGVRSATVNSSSTVWCGTSALTTMSYAARCAAAPYFLESAPAAAPPAEVAANTAVISRSRSSASAIDSTMVWLFVRFAGGNIREALICVAASRFRSTAAECATGWSDGWVATVPAGPCFPVRGITPTSAECCCGLLSWSGGARAVDPIPAVCCDDK